MLNWSHTFVFDEVLSISILKLRPTAILKFYVKCEINAFAHKIFHLTLHLLSFDEAIACK